MPGRLVGPDLPRLTRLPLSPVQQRQRRLDDGARILRVGEGRPHRVGAARHHAVCRSEHRRRPEKQRVEVEEQGVAAAAQRGARWRLVAVPHQRPCELLTVEQAGEVAEQVGGHVAHPLARAARRVRPDHTCLRRLRFGEVVVGVEGLRRRRGWSPARVGPELQQLREVRGEVPELTAQAVEAGDRWVAGEGPEHDGVLRQLCPEARGAKQEVRMPGDLPVGAELQEGDVVVQHPHDHGPCRRVRKAGDGHVEVGAQRGELCLAGSADRHRQALAERRQQPHVGRTVERLTKVHDGHTVDGDVRPIGRRIRMRRMVLDDENADATWVTRLARLIDKGGEQTTHRRITPYRGEHHEHVGHVLPIRRRQLGALDRAPATEREPARLLEQRWTSARHHLQRVVHELRREQEPLDQERPGCAAPPHPARRAPHARIACVLRVPQGEDRVGADANRAEAGQERPEVGPGVVGGDHRREVLVRPRRRVHDIDGLERPVGQHPQQRRSARRARIEAEPPALKRLLLHGAIERPGAQVGVPVADIA